MNYGKAIVMFFSNQVFLTKQMRSCGKNIFELQKVDNVLIALSIKFDHIVVPINKSKDFSQKKIEGVQASPEAHELKLKLINLEELSKQALHTKHFEKMKEES